MKVKHFKLLEYTDLNHLNKYNYTIPQLKKLCRHHNLRVGGNKMNIKKRLYTNFHDNYSAYKIQSIWRKSLYNKLYNYKSIQSNKKSVNSTDFYTLDPIHDIPYVYRFNILEKEHIYCFHVNSFKKLLTKKENPYTRSKITNNIIVNFYNHYKLLSLLGLIHLDEVEYITPAQQLTQKTLSIFQKIEGLGFLTDTKWFDELSNIKLLKFIKNFMIYGHIGQI